MKKKFQVGDVVKISEGADFTISKFVGKTTVVIEDSEYTPEFCVNVDLNHNTEGGLNVPESYLELVKANDSISLTKKELTDFIINFNHIDLTDKNSLTQSELRIFTFLNL